MTYSKPNSPNDTTHFAIPYFVLFFLLNNLREKTIKHPHVWANIPTSLTQVVIGGKEPTDDCALNINIGDDICHMSHLCQGSMYICREKLCSYMITVPFNGYGGIAYFLLILWFFWSYDRVLDELYEYLKGIIEWFK
jgi:hypothetical protein